MLPGSPGAEEVAPRPLRKNHSWTLLWTASTLSAVGNRLTLFVLPLFAVGLTGSATFAGAIVASSLAGQAVALIPAGAFVDRFLPLRVLRISALLQTTMSAVIVLG